MRNVIIFGTDQFAELLYFYLQDDKEYNVVAFTVDRQYMKTCELHGKPVICFENIEKEYNPQEYGLFLCIGYNWMNQVREQKYKEAKNKGYKIMSYCHPSSLVSTKDIGEGNIIMEGVIIGAFAKIGKGNVFYAKAHIAHHTIIGDFNFFAISVAVAGNVLIKNNCFFGNNCTVRNDIRIDSFTLIGAAAYISEDTMLGDVYVPARSIKLAARKSIDFNLTKKPNE